MTRKKSGYTLCGYSEVIGLILWFELKLASASQRFPSGIQHSTDNACKADSRAL